MFLFYHYLVDAPFSIHSLDGFHINPQELVWNLLKRRELKNLCCRDLAHLRHALVCAKERLRHRQDILQHCFTHTLAEV